MRTRPSVNYAKDWLDHSFLFLVLSGLKKTFTLDVFTRGQSTNIFLCIGPFLASWQTNEQTNNRVIREQACSWPVWQGSLLQYKSCGYISSLNIHCFTGVRKGGTRALLEMLSLHPVVRMAAQVCTHSNNSHNCDLNSHLDPRRFTSLTTPQTMHAVTPGRLCVCFYIWHFMQSTRYLSQMPPLTGGQLAMEKSPSYLVTPGVAQRIHTMDPKVVVLSKDIWAN